ncbi:hypothetical protein I5907_00805 [Panacibacter sp. DH6]|uniref:Uncharacterized protein n=1 Tax=Panacibacter microcysteis TaxID=2793269 RepID=A0A931GWZ3_9BACT|nr:hypothetical protein [Panacibacter microcysteis]MBG9374759.1 hypothetical protein [Panacibacter microcysteis]
MEDFENMSEEERLKAENDFLKMKLMLEKGATFEKTDPEVELPADFENKFLKNILEFEKQFDQHKTTTVFDKIGRPAQFKPVNDIPDEAIEDEWLALYNYLIEHGIEVSVNNPAVTSRELYRFTTEDLFEYETDDVTIPGMVSGFVYDDFYPDYEFENSRAALEDGIKIIFSRQPVETLHGYANKITLNDHKDLSEEKFKLIINRFKDAFEDIILNATTVEQCVIEETACTVKGTYSATATLVNETINWNDEWSVIFHFDDNLGYWEIVTVLIQNIRF